MSSSSPSVNSRASNSLNYLNKKARSITLESHFIPDDTEILEQDPNIDFVELIIHSDINFVYERRHITIEEDNGKLIAKFTDVPSDLDPSTVHFESITDPHQTKVIQQNFSNNINQDKLTMTKGYESDKKKRVPDKKN